MEKIDRQLEWDLEHCIPLQGLQHGCYYTGKCRNATIARWNSHDRRWYYWRVKFSAKFVDSVQAMEDAGGNRLDYFAPKTLVDWGVEEIPFPDRGELV